MHVANFGFSKRYDLIKFLGIVVVVAVVFTLIIVSGAINE